MRKMVVNHLLTIFPKLKSKNKNLKCYNKNNKTLTKILKYHKNIKNDSVTI